MSAGLLLDTHVFVVYLCFWLRWLPFSAETRELGLRVTRGLGLVAGILAAERVLSLLLIARLRDPVSRYNLHRVADLAARGSRPSRSG